MRSGGQVVETNRTILRRVLLADYKDFFDGLKRRLGPAELAGEALQETFLRLERVVHARPVLSPKSYLYRIAVNIAIDRRRAEARHLSGAEVDSLLDLADPSPDPARVVEARSEIEHLKRAVAELPQRRREILLAARLDEVPNREIAKRYGVTVRTIETEIKAAVEYCASRLDRRVGRLERNAALRYRSVPAGSSSV
jgi:RNA polymerase sigma-70 factor (ECF subfamily)